MKVFSSLGYFMSSPKFPSINAQLLIFTIIYFRKWWGDIFQQIFVRFSSLESSNSRIKSAPKSPFLKKLPFI